MDSFPQILFSVWQTKITGRILVKTETAEKELSFKNGTLVVERDMFDEEAFRGYLLERKILDAPSAKRCEARAKKMKTTLIAILLDLDLLSPQFLWKNMEAFSKHNLFPLFDFYPLDSSLISEKPPSDAAILLTVSTLSLIQEGIYRMKNIELIDALLPKDEDLQKLTPDHLDQIHLHPYEEQLINALGEKNDLQNLIASGSLGENFTKKALFALFCLGILSTSPAATPNKPLQEISAAELQKILITFNAKCSYIYKSVSKELGPVALNLMEKSIEDIKPSLSRHFRKIRLGPDGKIDLQPVLKANIILSDRDTIQTIIKSLNEILSAEILAVKKTLGSEFESALTKNLEKIGG